MSRDLNGWGWTQFSGTSPRISNSLQFVIYSSDRPPLTTRNPSDTTTTSDNAVLYRATCSLA
ncbi:hypothetical protein J6590_073415 [Homalodisca vitripennis]|nr:hypothetical protein J6590_073415 [Homalodisca vitripennis]